MLQTVHNILALLPVAQPSESLPSPVGDSSMEALVIGAMLVLLRVSGLLLTMPVFSLAIAPKRIRAGLAVVLAMPLAFSVPQALATQEIGVSALFLSALGELALGAAIGGVIRIVFAAMDVAAEVAGMQMGFGFASTVDPSTQQNTGIVGRIMGAVLTLVFLASGGHRDLLRALAASFDIFPSGGVFSTLANGPAGLASSTWTAWAMERGAEVFIVGLRIAAPLIFVAFLSHITFGLLTRVAPQLNVWALGFTFTIGASLLALSVLAPTLVRESYVLVERGLALTEGMLLP